MYAQECYMIESEPKSQRALLIRGGGGEENAGGKETQPNFDWQMFPLSFLVVYKIMVQSYC